MVKKKSSKVGSLDEILDLDDADIEGLDADQAELPIKDPFVEDTAAAIKPAVEKPQYRINGLSPDREKDAIKMLDAGKDIAEVMDIFGVARSDIMTLNIKK